MNCTKKQLLFLFAFTTIGFTLHAASGPESIFKNPQLIAGLKKVHVDQAEQERADKLFSARNAAQEEVLEQYRKVRDATRPGTPTTNPRLTIPRQRLDLSFLESRPHQPSSPCIKPTPCLVIPEDAPLTPQPAGACAIPKSPAQTPAHSAPMPTSASVKISAAAQAQRKNTLSAPSQKQTKLVLSHVAFVTHNKSPRALRDFYHDRQHALGLPAAAPFMLKTVGRKPETRLRTTSPA